MVMGLGALCSSMANQLSCCCSSEAVRCFLVYRQIDFHLTEVVMSFRNSFARGFISAAFIVLFFFEADGVLHSLFHEVRQV